MDLGDHAGVRRTIRGRLGSPRVPLAKPEIELARFGAGLARELRQLDLCQNLLEARIRAKRFQLRVGAKQGGIAKALLDGLLKLRVRWRGRIPLWAEQARQMALISARRSDPSRAPYPSFCALVEQLDRGLTPTFAGGVGRLRRGAR